jgi:hypothetical protein
MNTPVTDDDELMEYIEGNDCAIQIGLVHVGSFHIMFSAIIPLIPAKSSDNEWITCVSLDVLIS